MFMKCHGLELFLRAVWEKEAVAQVVFIPIIILEFVFYYYSGITGPSKPKDYIDQLVWRH